MSGTQQFSTKFTPYNSNYVDAARAVLLACPLDNIAHTQQQKSGIEELLREAGRNNVTSVPRIIIGHISTFPSTQTSMGLVAYQPSSNIKGLFTLGNLCVVPIARGQKLATDLMKEAHKAILGQAEKMNLPAVIIELEQGGMSTEHFYNHNFGYTVTGKGITGDNLMRVTFPNPKYTP